MVVSLPEGKICVALKKKGFSGTLTPFAALAPLWPLFDDKGSTKWKLSNEKETGYLPYRGDCTTQLYRDCNKPL